MRMAKRQWAVRWEGELLGYMQVRGADGFFLYGPWKPAQHPREAELWKLLEAEEDAVVELEEEGGWARLLLRRPPEKGEIELRIYRGTLEGS